MEVWPIVYENLSSESRLETEAAPAETDEPVNLQNLETGDLRAAEEWWQLS